VSRLSLALVGFVVALWGVSVLGLLLVCLKGLAMAIHAWAQDGLVPVSWGYIRQGQNAPVVALCITAASMLVGVVLGIGGLSVTLVLYDPYALALSSLVTTSALILFPFRRREWFVRTPFARRSWLTVTVGLLATAFLEGVVWGPGDCPITYACRLIWVGC